LTLLFLQELHLVREKDIVACSRELDKSDIMGEVGYREDSTNVKKIIRWTINSTLSPKTAPC